eukprot:m.303623 g.303623  ORF g.303623 m.303623 type:complete len:53 (-) comp16042_c0_seq1:214-372(-)
MDPLGPRTLAAIDALFEHPWIADTLILVSFAGVSLATGTLIDRLLGSGLRPY